MDPQEVLSDLKAEMEATLSAFRKEMARIRTGRASTALLDGIHAEYYGAKTPLNQISTITAPEPRLIVVQPYDRTALTAIERAIQQSDLGLNPVNDGKILRIPIPELNEERRREIVRHVRKLAEEYRVSMRSHRHDAIELLKEMLKEKAITEDENHRAKEKIEGETKTFLDRLEEVLKAKEKDVMEV